MSAAEKILPDITYTYITEHLDELPTLPSIVSEISQLINDPVSTVKDIEIVMLKDQSMTTKVLKLINSAYYSIPGGIQDLGRAIAYLGYDAIYQLVLSTSVLQALKVEDQENFDMKKFWKHSIGCAITSEVIAKKIKHKNPQELFTAGLIHDIGKVALLCVAPEYLTIVSKVARAEDLTLAEAEIKLEALKHGQIGGLLAEKWKLPPALIAVIKHHHTAKTELRSGLNVEDSQYVDIVMFANHFIHAVQFGDSGYDKKPKIPTELFRRLMIAEANVPEYAKAIKEGLSFADSFLEIIGS